MVDPTGSAFHQCWSGEAKDTTEFSSLIEGIGRPRAEQSFIAAVVDDVQVVNDLESIGAARAFSKQLGRPCGASTGANLQGVIRVATKMRAASEQGSIVSLICDDGHRYMESYHCDTWVRERGLNTRQVEQSIAESLGWVL